MHLHLDLTGGIAGDMFTAAMLDAFPELEQPLRQALDFMVSDLALTLDLHDGVNHGISGKRFNVIQTETPADSSQSIMASETAHHHEQAGHGHLHIHHVHGHQTHSHQHDEHAYVQNAHGHHEHHHFHRSWKDIRHFIEHAPLAEPIKKIAVGIFGLLAKAEATVHQMDVENVQFHEVGAWDCIADILSAAWLINASRASSWSVSKLPWGGGTVKCAHGLIPVPAPATLNLLGNYEFIDDGQTGERITPTGAAILAWLSPAQHLPNGQLTRVGYGLGTREFVNIPNILRISAFSTEQATEQAKLQQEQITVIQCDIDDMTGELLAIARENLRQQMGVLEVTESVSHGKKNRLINTLTLLCKPEHFPEIQRTVFEQTSTLGIRYWTCDRITLPRKELQQGQFRTKVAERPGGISTCKLEADHLMASDTHHQRVRLKRQVEQQVEESVINDCQ